MNVESFHGTAKRLVLAMILAAVLLTAAQTPVFAVSTGGPPPPGGPPVTGTGGSYGGGGGSEVCWSADGSGTCDPTGTRGVRAYAPCAAGLVPVAYMPDGVYYDAATWPSSPYYVPGNFAYGWAQPIGGGGTVWAPNRWAGSGFRFSYACGTPSTIAPGGPPGPPAVTFSNPGAGHISLYDPAGTAPLTPDASGTISDLVLQRLKAAQDNVPPPTQSAGCAGPPACTLWIMYSFPDTNVSWYFDDGSTTPITTATIATLYTYQHVHPNFRIKAVRKLVATCSMSYLQRTLVAGPPARWIWATVWVANPCNPNDGVPTDTYTYSIPGLQEYDSFSDPLTVYQIEPVGSKS